VTLCLKDSNRSLGHVVVKVTSRTSDFLVLYVWIQVWSSYHTLQNKVNTNLSNSLCAIGIPGTREGLEKGVLEMCYKCYTYKKPFTTIEPE
jgi:hypothetical protein